MFGNFFMKQIIASQLKALPQDQRERVMKAFEANPDFFKKIFAEIETKVKSGANQQNAIMQVMMAHKDELQRLLKP